MNTNEPVYRPENADDPETLLKPVESAKSQTPFSDASRVHNADLCDWGHEWSPYCRYEDMQKLELLAQDLWEFAEHAPQCPRSFSKEGVCDCGHAEVQKRLEELGK